MNTSEVNRFDFGPADWNATNTFRATSINQDTVNADNVAFQNTGEGKRPLSPVHLAAERNGSNDDVLIQWVRRSRYQTPTIGGGPTPLGEAIERYELDIYSGLTIVRTVQVDDATEYNYTTAEQTADGNTPGAPVRVDVYQISDVYGRGHVAEGTV